MNPAQSPVHRAGRVADERPRVVGIEGEVRVLAEGVDDVAGDRVEDDPSEADDGDQRRGSRDRVAIHAIRECEAPRPEEDPYAHQQRGAEGQRTGRGGQVPGQANQIDPGEGEADESRRSEPGGDRGQDALRIGFPLARGERSPQDNEADQEAQDAELDLGQRGDHGEGRGEFAAIPKKSPQAEQHEDGADHVRLAPDRAVEPGDRVEHDHGRGDQGPPARRPQLLRHAEDEIGQGQVRDDGDQLD